MSKPTAISLFSGMGGDTLGLTQGGFDVIAFNEYDPSAIESHMANFPNSKLICDPSQKKPKDRNDITKIPDAIFAEYKDKVDLIFAGHPCQGFSQGGKKLPDDPRNTLFREFARVTKIISPKFIIGENVDGLLSRKTSSGEKYFDVIVKEFNDLGYDVYHKVCNVVQYGVPQLRKRLIYVGVRNDLGKTFHFPDVLNDGKNNLPDLRDIVQFSMEGAIQIFPDDFDMNSIPNECILTDMDNHDLQSEYVHPYLTLKAKTRNAQYNGVLHYQTLSFAKKEIHPFMPKLLIFATLPKLSFALMIINPDFLFLYATILASLLDLSLTMNLNKFKDSLLILSFTAILNNKSNKSNAAPPTLILLIVNFGVLPLLQ